MTFEEALDASLTKYELALRELARLEAEELRVAEAQTRSTDASP